MGFLINLSERLSVRGYSSSEFVMRMSREEVAKYLGLGLWTVSRLFSRFAKAGLIQVHQAALTFAASSRSAATHADVGHTPVSRGLCRGTVELTLVLFSVRFFTRAGAFTNTMFDTALLPDFGPLRPASCACGWVRPAQCQTLMLFRNVLWIFRRPDDFFENFASFDLEWLSQYCWEDLSHVRDFATQWMWQYNHERPIMGLGGMTPKQRLMAAA